MYIPKHFEIIDEEQIYKLIDNNGFATLISTDKDNIPIATHLPLTLDHRREFLYGHFARANHQWQNLEGQCVLAIFQGPHCYISSSWYETKRSVPTWNYLTAHVYGKIEIVEGKEVQQSLKELVGKYEQENSTYQLSEIDRKYIDGMTKGVVGFRINISELQGKAKLSQNHSVNRRKLVIDELKKSPCENEQRIAKEMEEHMINIKRVNHDQIDTLRNISIETFNDTFKEQNTKENTEAYLQSAFNSQQLKKELVNQSSEFYFAYVNNDLIGYLKVNSDEAQTEEMGFNSLEIERIYIRSMYQRKGFGDLLLRKVIDLAKEKNKTRIWIGVWEKNEKAIAFYKNKKFVQATTHSFYMGDEEQIDIIMTRTLE